MDESIKTMEAPEKIYIPTAGDEMHYHMACTKNDFKESVEYVRTDTFVKKVEEWLKYFNDNHYIMRYSDSCEVPLERIIEDFRKHMKGE